MSSDRNKKPASNDEPDESIVRLGRRVVTGFDEDGKSRLWLDGKVPKSAIFHFSQDQIVANVVWATDQVPVVIEKDYDPMVKWFQEHDWFPSVGVHVFIATWQPGSSYPMHASDTLDIGFVLSGEIELIMENGSTILGPGDCFVQRGTQHAWRVVGDKPCVWAGILMAKKPDGES